MLELPALKGMEFEAPSNGICLVNGANV